MPEDVPVDSTGDLLLCLSAGEIKQNCKPTNPRRPTCQRRRKIVIGCVDHSQQSKQVAHSRVVKVVRDERRALEEAEYVARERALEAASVHPCSILDIDTFGIRTYQQKSRCGEKTLDVSIPST